MRVIIQLRILYVRDEVFCFYIRKFACQATKVNGIIAAAWHIHPDILEREVYMYFIYIYIYQGGHVLNDISNKVSITWQLSNNAFPPPVPGETQFRAARTTDKKSLPPFAISDREQHARLTVNKRQRACSTISALNNRANPLRDYARLRYI